MSPRKSTSSAAEASSHDEEHNAPVEGSRTAGGSADAADSGVNVEDYLLPRSLTQRLAKGVLPPNTSIQKDALLAISKAATVFVSYLSSHANEETEKKTVTPQDVFAALSEIEFDAFLPRLERELAVYTEAAAQKRRGKKDRKAGAAAGEGSSKDDGAVEGGAGEPGAKRVKRDGEAQIVVGRGRPGEKVGDVEDEDQTEEEQEQEEEEGEGEEEGEEGGEDEDEEEEEEEEEAQGGGRGEDDVDIDDGASDTARRRHPDLDSGAESDSDGL
ncbi:hypothetical protein AJ79_09613 [Helicocarpus griseus UAMH5409]|uniref:DNA polymerase epsilon subunit D n=1 Tax=Helicocarpus griseus UAMH5409 TaxID=1447875 RepID=A0A2B7WA01_9EURO|nr:hypothetical protein AJ79_09613 [Helicocarpus griseus UAMH5409]